ncbi:MAG: ABC transporter ATP-binding protein [Treponema sp.]|uniref:ABC transporter ATP-binding protein n=1 Tax=Treponema sp. TaxID=166 RepID=UPI00298DA90C|nr:ABC transporter ATP-binding protein [Treponema sp.]MDD5812512.1 ABC transporter ATP-binding protein [Treponema sp.]
MKNNIIEIKDLEKTYVSKGESLTVLKDLSFSIEEGTRTAIVGSSGNGKSTLLNIISGIDTATSGFVKVGKYELSKMTEKDLCKYRSEFIGLVFQFHYLLKDFTALENIFLPAYMAGKNKKIAMEKAESLLQEIGLYGRKNHLPSELSGGERQRVAVARSLINDPKIILADEPTGNLDPENAALISDLLYGVSEKYSKTLVIVTHDIEVAKKAQVIYRLQDKQIVQENKE